MDDAELNNELLRMTDAYTDELFPLTRVEAATAKMRLVQFADEIIAVLSSDPNAAVKITVDIAAEFPDGATDQVKRAVSENARSLGLKSTDWE